LVIALAFGIVQRVEAQARATAKSEPRLSWYECDPRDPTDTTCRVKSKSPKDRDNPDAPLALTFGYGVRIGSQPDRRLVNVLPAMQWLAALSFDIKSYPFAAVALEGQYTLEGQSSNALYGGTVSTALTIHSIAFGPLIRFMLDDSAQPLFSFLIRVAPGWTWGQLEWRDAASRVDRLMHSDTPYLISGVGVTFRPAGLTLETGILRPFDEFEFKQYRSVERLKLSQTGEYVRLSLSIRLP
jgi:hypothetical protein